MRQLSILLISCIAMIATLSVSSCQSNKKKEQQQEETVATTALSVDELLTEAESLTETTVTVEGVCTHICAHGAKKIFLMGTDDTKTIRIEASDATGAFSQDCVNSLVSVVGKVVEQRIDEAYLQNWEEQIKAATAEKHGDGKSAGCSSQQKAQGEATTNTVEDRIANFRTRIAEEKEKTGKDYLSFYHIVADSYTIK